MNDNNTRVRGDAAVADSPERKGGFRKRGTEIPKPMYLFLPTLFSTPLFVLATDRQL